MLNETKTKIVVLGDLCLDLFMQVPFYPEKGGDGIGQSWLKQSGGSASNTAVALAHLGYAPHFFTHTGDDLWAQQLLATLSQEGVNISNIVKEEQDSVGITFLAVTPDGERTMFTYRGANSRLQPNEITPEKMAGAAMLHLSGYACLTPPQSDTAWKAVEIASELGIGVSLDIGFDPARSLGEKLLKLLPEISLLVLGEADACVIAGTSSVAEAVQFLINHGVGLVALKLGEHGCQLTTRERQVEIPGFRVEVVDTTGAGDAFSAAMIYGRCQGWNLEEMGLFANAMGGLAATRWGAGTALPRLPEVTTFLEKQDQRRPHLQNLLRELSN